MSQPASPALQARAFINTLYSRATSGWWEFRPTNTKGAPQSWFPLDDLPRFDWLLKRWAGYHGFFGVHPRRGKGEGGRAGVESLVAVFVDVDGKRTPDHAAAFKHALTAFSHRPSLLVATGSPGSYHAYWVLRDPLPITDENERAYHRAMLGLAQHFGGDLVADLPRVMRLPGTVNLKPGNGGSLARLLLCDLTRVYSLADFEPWAVEPSARRESHAVAIEDGDELLDEFARRGWLLNDQGGAKFFVRCPWDGQHSGKTNDSSTALWKMDGRWWFKCFHEHCKTRWRQEVLDYFQALRVAELFAGVR